MYNRKRYEANPEYRKLQKEYSRKWKREKYTNDPEYRKKCRDSAKAYRKRMGPIHRQVKLYKITVEEHSKLLSNQNNACAICLKETKLAIDHDHGTGKVRGLLCPKCNGGLGMFLDNPDLLRKAINYLEISLTQFPPSL